jgi:RHS repeat-associated protein
MDSAGAHKSDRWQQNGPRSFVASFTGNNSTNNNRMDGYSYDSAGNLMNDGTNQYKYDAENRILQVNLGSSNGALIATYAYDPDGNRVQKTTASGGSGGDPNGTWQFLYDQSGRMLQRFNGTLWQGNIYVGGRHLAEDGGGTNISHSDWLGTERARVYYQNNAVCETIASLPFGDGQTTTGACYHSSPLHFTGKERDSESGLDYFGARYYSSSTGRFASPDWSPAPEPVPYANLTNPQTLNLYTIVADNPETFADLDGHISEEALCSNAHGCNPFDEQAQQKQQPKQQPQQQARKHRARHRKPKSPYQPKNKMANVVFNETGTIQGDAQSLHDMRVDTAHVYMNVKHKSAFQGQNALSAGDQTAIANGINVGRL